MALPSLAQIMLKLYKTSSCNSSINHLRIKCSFLCLYFSLIVLHQLLVFQLSPFLSPCFFPVFPTTDHPSAPLRPRWTEVINAPDNYRISTHFVADVTDANVGVLLQTVEVFPASLTHVHLSLPLSFSATQALAIRRPS